LEHLAQGGGVGLDLLRACRILLDGHGRILIAMARLRPDVNMNVDKDFTRRDKPRRLGGEPEARIHHQFYFGEAECSVRPSRR
jgi:hypothetical protein